MPIVELGQLELNTLLAVRSAAETAVRSIDTLLALIEAQQQNEEPTPIADPKTCPHPRRTIRSTAVMGKPNRGMCGVCGAEVEIKR